MFTTMMWNLVVGLVLLARCHAYPSEQIEGRIVNGTDAKLGDFKSIVSIQLGPSGHYCGGTILDATHILTAAHCVNDHDTLWRFIQFGVTDIRENKNFIEIKRIQVHEWYQHSHNYPNDIAIITLYDPIPFSETVQPAKLPTSKAPLPEGTVVTIAGWGWKNDTGSTTWNLQRAELEMYSLEECKSIHRYFDKNFHICAGYRAGGVGQCYADSGGPLYADGVQVGVVSWSVKPCGLKGYPGVFTNVANYVDWIKEICGW